MQAEEGDLGTQLDNPEDPMLFLEALEQELSQSSPDREESVPIQSDLALHGRFGIREKCARKSANPISFWKMNLLIAYDKSQNDEDLSDEENIFFKKHANEYFKSEKIFYLDDDFILLKWLIKIKNSEQVELDELSEVIDGKENVSNRLTFLDSLSEIERYSVILYCLKFPELRSKRRLFTFDGDFCILESSEMKDIDKQESEFLGLAFDAFKLLKFQPIHQILQVLAEKKEELNEPYNVEIKAFLTKILYDHYENKEENDLSEKLVQREETCDPENNISDFKGWEEEFEQNTSDQPIEKIKIVHRRFRKFQSDDPNHLKKFSSMSFKGKLQQRGISTEKLIELIAFSMSEQYDLKERKVLSELKEFILGSDK